MVIYSVWLSFITREHVSSELHDCLLWISSNEQENILSSAALCAVSVICFKQELQKNVLGFWDPYQMYIAPVAVKHLRGMFK